MPRSRASRRLISCWIVGGWTTRDSQPISQIGKITVDAVAPGVAKGLNLLRFAGDVADVAILNVAASGGPLEIAVELDAVGRIEIDALDAPAKPLPLGQTGHDLEGISQNHTVRPVLVMVIELGFIHTLWHTVEI